MNVLRTPDDRFADLPDYPFEPHYVEIGDGNGGGLRVHYLDEGPADGDIVLLLHGEPSWSFLYRHMIPELVAAGHRCIAPDLIGFGRSDKPSEPDDYSYAGHVQWMCDALFEELNLTAITLFAQDWGGLVGLRLVAEHPDRFVRVVIGNSGLPTGDQKVSGALAAWQEYAATAPTLDIGQIVNMGCASDLSAEVMAAYDAPFPDDTFKAGARIFPSLIPTSPDNVAAPAQKAAWDVLRTFDRPFLCTFSDSDPLTKGADRAFCEEVPGAEGQPHTTIEGAAHFLQEDQGPALAQVINHFIATT